MSTPNIRSPQLADKVTLPQPKGEQAATPRVPDHSASNSAISIAAPGDADIQSATESEQVILPVVEETLQVGKRNVESGKVVVSVQPTQVQQAVDVELTREDVQVERVAVNRVVEQVLPPREEGDVTIIPIYEEVLVVEKRLVLKEEIRLTRKRTQHQERRMETLRKEEVTISRTPVDEPPPR